MDRLLAAGHRRNHAVSCTIHYATNQCAGPNCEQQDTKAAHERKVVPPGKGWTFVMISADVQPSRVSPHSPPEVTPGLTSQAQHIVGCSVVWLSLHNPSSRGIHAATAGPPNSHCPFSITGQRLGPCSELHSVLIEVGLVLPACTRNKLPLRGPCSQIVSGCRASCNAWE